MHRVDDPDFIIVGGKRRFKESPPPGTVVGWTMMNTLQEEIAGVIEDAGITLRVSGSADNAVDYASQLLEAIDDKIEDAVDLIEIELDDLQDQIDLITIDVDDVIGNINTVVSFAGLTPDITSNTLLKQAVVIISRIPRDDEIDGFNIGIRKSGSVFQKTQIVIDEGECADNYENIIMRYTVPIRKSIAASWTYGQTGQGGFPGSLSFTTDTLYYVFLIRNSDGRMDAGFDSNSSAVNLLADAISEDGAGWIYWRRMGTVVTAAAGTEMIFSEDIKLDKNITRLRRAIFPVEVMHVSPSGQIIFCQSERVGDVVNVLFPAFVDSAVSDELTYNFLTSAPSKKPGSLQTQINISTPCVFQGGTANNRERPGKLILSTPRFTAEITGASDSTMDPNFFDTGGDKGMATPQNITFQMWNEN